MQKTKKGFTLIELVVVMAIIAVLAALMVTAIVAARKAATNTQITGNAKTIETALETYSTKTSGSYPSETQLKVGDANIVAAVVPPATSPALTASGVVNYLRDKSAGYSSLSGGPAGLKNFQIYYKSTTGASYTLTACDDSNDAWGTTTDQVVGANDTTGITVGVVNQINTTGPCKSGSKVVYSTAR